MNSKGDLCIQEVTNKLKSVENKRTKLGKNKYSDPCLKKKSFACMGKHSSKWRPTKIWPAATSLSYPWITLEDRRKKSELLPFLLLIPLHQVTWLSPNELLHVWILRQHLTCWRVFTLPSFEQKTTASISEFQERKKFLLKCSIQVWTGLINEFLVLVTVIYTLP